MANRTKVLASLLLVAAACGDDGNNNPGGDGGGGDGNNTCTTAALSIASVPGMVSGTVVGGGADLSAPKDTCTDQYEWYDPVGEDKVVAISGLTIGQRYGLTLQTETDDLSLYVTGQCPPASGAVTSCTSFTDEAFPSFFGNGPEAIAFTATATTEYVVIDTALGMKDIEDGNFQLDVTTATCGPQTAEADCASTTPYCLDFACKQCISGFDCAAGTPSCDGTNTCVAGPAQCTGDDAGDSGAGDDGPSVAKTIGTPTAVTPTTVNAAICSTPASEEDWYKIALTEDVRVSLTFTGATNDIDVYLFDSAGEIVTGSAENAGINEAFLTEDLEPGMYYINVLQYAPANTAAAVPYVLTVALPECDPSEFALTSCTTAAEPICGDTGECVAGPATCLLDTDGEPNDDGPAGARTLTSGNPLIGQACTAAGEFDWYKFTVTNGQAAAVSLAWTDAAKDFDLQVLDGTGKVYGFSLNARPEVVTLTNLPAGTYYARVQNYGQASTTSDAYSITTSITTSSACATNKCAAEFKTQVYRGACTTATNICSFIPDSDNVAVGGSCDSDGDCAGTSVCSYATFQSNADKSKCGPMTCATTADCTAAGADFKCTTFTSGNTCMPSCAANTDCGASNGTTLEPNFPWDYFTCTAAAGTCGP